MNEQIFARFLRDLIESRTPLPLEQVVRLSQFPNQRFRIKIEQDSVPPGHRDLFEAKATTISALPPGAKCESCGGSGRVR